MERFIIPFEYKTRNFYVFIEKHEGSNFFDITQLVPETDDVAVRQIPVTALKSYHEPADTTIKNLDQTIMSCLASWLQERGWPVDEQADS